MTALIDSGGTVLATDYYDSFGNIISSTGTFDNPYKYAGYYYDSETGDYYLLARYYDPVTARFLSEDTYRGNEADPLSLNLYTYCFNNPMIYIDPTGHQADGLYKNSDGSYTRTVNGQDYTVYPDDSTPGRYGSIAAEYDSANPSNSGGSSGSSGSSGSGSSGGSSTSRTQDGYTMNADGSITHIVSGTSYTVWPDDERYERVLGELLGANIGSQDGASLRETVAAQIPNGDVVWSGVGRPVDITINQGKTVLATLNYNSSTGTYATEGGAITGNLTNGQLIITKDSNQVSGNSSSGRTQGSNSTGTSTTSSGASDGSVWPVGGDGGTITATYPTYSGGAPHTGVDIANPTGTPVYASYSGTVITSTLLTDDKGNPKSYGNYIVVESVVNGTTVTIYYCHLDSREVSKGDTVTSGQEIGTVGETGYATGPHLHYEVRIDNKPVDPMPYLPER